MNTPVNKFQTRADLWLLSLAYSTEAPDEELRVLQTGRTKAYGLSVTCI